MGAKRVTRYLLPTVHRLYSMRFLFIQMYDSSLYSLSNRVSLGAAMMHQVELNPLIGFGTFGDFKVIVEDSFVAGYIVYFV